MKQNDQFSGSNSRLLGSHHLPASRDQCGCSRSNPHMGTNNIVLNILIRLPIPLSKSSRPPQTPIPPEIPKSHRSIKILNNFHTLTNVHLIGDNWCWTCAGGFWNRKQDGRHLWDRLQHLLLVSTIKLVNWIVLTLPLKVI